jgi:hypothetical protein
VPLLVRGLISGDGRVAGVNVDCCFSEGDKNAQNKAAAWACSKKAKLIL